MVMIWNIFNYLNGSCQLGSNHCCGGFLLVEVLINLILVKAGLFDEESDETDDS
jgi:hypothetical protein